MGLGPFLLQAQLFCKCRENSACSEEDIVALWQQNLFLATKRDMKINNDSCQQALNCSLNPSPSGRRITVRVLPCVKKTFLQNYRYSRTTNEHFSSFSLQKSILLPLCTKVQGSNRKPTAGLEVLLAYASLSHHLTSQHHLLVQTPTSTSQDRKR